MISAMGKINSDVQERVSGLGDSEAVVLFKGAVQGSVTRQDTLA